MRSQQIQINEVLGQRSQRQHKDLSFDAIDPQQSQNRKSRVASTQLETNDDQVMLAPRYSVDDNTESQHCELHVKVVNITMKAAVSFVLRPGSTPTYHCRPVLDGYAVAGVDEVMAGFELVKLDFPADHGAPSINFNQFLEKEKLKSNGSNFTDWFRHCAILCSLEAELQKRFEHHDPCEMMRELKVIFETHAAVESYEASKQFFGCMMEEGSSVSEHVFAMSGHAKKLSDLGIVIPNQLGIHRVLQSLPPSYKNFVMNYNMQNMNKELPELFSMLKSAEVEIQKENQVLMVNKTTSFKKQGNPNDARRCTRPLGTPRGRYDAPPEASVRNQGLIGPVGVKKHVEG
ncbi:hypothetical protein QYE76_068583 [Lolium multiflorum]|uniref:DUF8039 domain-containing protein n=1 Tax=Lolium multiflorum TaxID=4521 RepID=A0AAD8WC31_LOLMU|nr:hypothetical protein QYE76_068583 [Lolium multiflorum]